MHHPAVVKVSRPHDDYVAPGGAASMRATLWGPRERHHQISRMRGLRASGDALRPRPPCRKAAALARNPAVRRAAFNRYTASATHARRCEVVLIHALRNQEVGDSLLPEVTHEQRTVIDRVVAYSIERDASVSGKRLRFEFRDRPGLLTVIESCVPLFLRQTGKSPDDLYSPTLIGLLCSSRTSMASRVLESVLLFLKDRFSDDPDFRQFSLAELQEADPALKHRGAHEVYAIISVAGLAGSTSRSDAGFQCDVPQHIEAIASWPGLADLIRYARSSSRIEGLDEVVPESHRRWLLEIVRFMEAGQRFDPVSVRVRLRDVLPADFNSNRIDNRVLDGGNITAVGLWIVDATSRSLQDADRVAQWVKGRFLANPEPTRITASEIAEALRLSQDYVGRLLVLITTLGSFWDMHSTPVNGQINCVQVGSEATAQRLLGFTSVESEIRAQVERLVKEPRTSHAPDMTHLVPASSDGLRTFHAYSKVEQVGEGAVGFVYRARNERGNEVAIKVMKKSHAGTSREGRFINEAQWCWRATSPHIARVLDWGLTRIDGVEVPFTVLRFYKASLRGLIKKGMSPDDVLRAFQGMAQGVAAAHRARVVHRDLKPENVFVDDDGTVVVGDFGIAHFQEEMLAAAVETEAGDRLANFEYAAPEQRRPSPHVDDRADVFALGLMLNEMFTGVVPLGGGFRRIDSISKKLANLDSLVDSMTRQVPAERPSIYDVLDRFAAVSAGDGGRIR